MHEYQRSQKLEVHGRRLSNAWHLKEEELLFGNSIFVATAVLFNRTGVDLEV